MVVFASQKVSRWKAVDLMRNKVQYQNHKKQLVATIFKTIVQKKSKNVIITSKSLERFESFLECNFEKLVKLNIF